MSFEFKALAPLMALAIAGCGSDSNDEFSGQPFARFTVNRGQDATIVTLPRGHVVVDNVAVFNRCKTITFANGNTLSFSNGGDVNDTKYCSDQAVDPNQTERTVTSATIVFGVQFFNNTYQDLILNYDGFGFAVKVFEYDEAAEDNLGDMVWHSDHYFQAQAEASKAAGLPYEDFDPGPKQPVVLEPLTSFPATSGALSDVGRIAEFTYSQNFLGRPSEGAYSYDPQDLYHWPSTGNDGMSGLCDWGPVEADGSTESDVVLEKVICRPYDLLPLPANDVPSSSGSSVYPFVTGQDAEGNIRFIARIEYSFDYGNGPMEEPEDVLITVTAPTP